MEELLGCLAECDVDGENNGDVCDVEYGVDKDQKVEE